MVISARQTIAGRSAAVAGLTRRAGLSACVTVGFLAILSSRIDGEGLGGAFWALRDIGAGQWMAAALAALVSLWAIGRYDGVLHGQLGTGFGGAGAARAGIAAITLSQALGLGLVTGTAVRMRLCPGLGAGRALQLGLLVTLSFLGCWAVLAAGALVWAGSPVAGQAGLAVLGLAGAGLAHQTLCAGRPGPLRRLPNARVLMQLLALSALDMAGAAMALWVLLPEGVATPAQVLPAFLLAYGAGLVAGTPGGLGSLDLVLVSLLPGADAGAVLTAVLGWRLAYVVFPAGLGAILVLAGPRSGPAPAPPCQPAGALLRAEFGLAGQDGLGMLAAGPALWLATRRGHHLIALMEPVPPCPPRPALTALADTARHEGRRALVHKAPARLAAVARAAGWAVWRTGWEALLRPESFDLAAPARAGLRRKLRHAERAGVRAELTPAGQEPWPRLAPVAASWAAAHGGERGVTMGRYSRRLIERQALIVAWQGDRLLAFATFHKGAGEWTLDLLRHGPDMPDGTMHLLVATAIRAAGRAGVARLSLAAVGDLARHPPRRGPLRWLARLAPALADPGLFRFKAAFAPEWRPLYLLAPSHAALATGALSLVRAICHPPAPDVQRIEQDHAEYGFALNPAPWHIAENP